MILPCNWFASEFNTWDVFAYTLWLMYKQIGSVGQNGNTSTSRPNSVQSSHFDCPLFNCCSMKLFSSTWPSVFCCSSSVLYFLVLKVDSACLRLVTYLLRELLFSCWISCRFISWCTYVGLAFLWTPSWTCLGPNSGGLDRSSSTYSIKSKITKW